MWILGEYSPAAVTPYVPLDFGPTAWKHSVESLYTWSTGTSLDWRSKDNASREAHPTKGDLHKGDFPKSDQDWVPKLLATYEARTEYPTLVEVYQTERNYFETEERSLPYDARGLTRIRPIEGLSFASRPVRRRRLQVARDLRFCAENPGHRPVGSPAAASTPHPVAKKGRRTKEGPFALVTVSSPIASGAVGPAESAITSEDESSSFAYKTAVFNSQSPKTARTKRTSESDASSLLKDYEEGKAPDWPRLVLDRELMDTDHTVNPTDASKEVPPEAAGKEDPVQRASPSRTPDSDDVPLAESVRASKEEDVAIDRLLSNMDHRLKVFYTGEDGVPTPLLRIQLLKKVRRMARSEKSHPPLPLSHASAEGEVEATAVVTGGPFVTPVSKIAQKSPTVTSTGEVIPGTISHSGNRVPLRPEPVSDVYVTPEQVAEEGERETILDEAAYGILHAPMCSNLAPATQPFYRDLHRSINGTVWQEMRDAQEEGGPDPGLPMTAVGNPKRVVLRQMPSEYPLLTARAYSGAQVQQMPPASAGEFAKWLGVQMTTSTSLEEDGCRHRVVAALAPFEPAYHINRRLYLPGLIQDKTGLPVRCAIPDCPQKAVAKCPMRAIRDNVWSSLV